MANNVLFDIETVQCVVKEHIREKVGNEEMQSDVRNQGREPGRRMGQKLRKKLGTRDEVRRWGKKRSTRGVQRWTLIAQGSEAEDRGRKVEVDSDR